MNTCPHCGAEPVNPQYPHIFDCGTFYDGRGKHRQGEACFSREPLFQELKKAKDRIALIEEAGDNVDSRIGCGCGVSGPCNICASASEAWAVAKCRKEKGSK